MRGTELRTLRQKLGLTLEQLATQLYHPTTFKRVSTATVSRWERSTMVNVLPSWVDIAAAAMEVRIRRDIGAKPKPIERHPLGAVSKNAAGQTVIWDGAKWV